MKGTALLALILALGSITVLADIKPPIGKEPKPRNEIDGRIYVSLRSDAKVPTLKIRREALKQLRAAIDKADDGQDNLLAYTEPGAGSLRMQTIVSGALFSFAFVFAGVWLFRRPGRSSKIALSLIAAAGLGIGAMAIFANSPPPGVVELTTRIFDKHTKVYGYATGNVKIQILDRQPGVFTGHDRDDVILEIPNGGEDKGSD